MIAAAAAKGEVIPHGLHTPVRVAVIIVVTMIVTAVARRVIRRSISGLVAVRELAPGAIRERSIARTHTLSTVLRSFVTALLWLIAIVAVIGELGINLGAFVATATIIGGAIAFGAQSLVKDILAGVYVLVEDQYGVGDLVDLGVASGRVERVTLRTTRLRDDQGRVWHVPNGVVQRAANLSQEWAQAVLDVPIPRDVDVDEASSALEAVAVELAAEPEFAERILDSPTVLGVQEVLDDRAILRLVIKTRPAEQFVVMRAMRARVLKAVAQGRLALAGPVVPAEPAPPTAPGS